MKTAILETLEVIGMALVFTLAYGVGLWFL